MSSVLYWGPRHDGVEKIIVKVFKIKPFWCSERHEGNETFHFNWKRPFLESNDDPKLLNRFIIVRNSSVKEKKQQGSVLKSLI